MDRMCINNPDEMVIAGVGDEGIRQGVENAGFDCEIYEWDFGHNSALIVKRRNDRFERPRRYVLRVGATETSKGIDILDGGSEAEAISKIVLDWNLPYPNFYPGL